MTPFLRTLQQPLWARSSSLVRLPHSPWRQPRRWYTRQIPGIKPEHVDDAYKALRLKRGAPWDEVKKKYRLLCKELHSDLNPHQKGNNRLVEVNNAKDILQDLEFANERARFDKYLNERGKAAADQNLDRIPRDREKAEAAQRQKEAADAKRQKAEAAQRQKEENAKRQKEAADAKRQKAEAAQRQKEENAKRQKEAADAKRQKAEAAQRQKEENAKRQKEAADAEARRKDDDAKAQNKAPPEISKPEIASRLEESRIKQKTTSGEANNGKKDEKQSAATKAKDAPKARANGDSQDPRGRIVVIPLPSTRPELHIHDVYCAVEPLRPGAVNRCDVTGSKATFEFFDHTAARRLVDSITSKGIRIESKLVTNANINMAKTVARETGLSYRVLAFNASPGTVAGGYCQTVQGMLDLLTCYGLKPGLVSARDAKPNTKTDLMLNFKSCADAQAVRELLARKHQDIRVQFARDGLSPQSFSSGSEARAVGDGTSDPGSDFNIIILLIFIVLLMLFDKQVLSKQRDAQAAKQPKTEDQAQAQAQAGDEDGVVRKQDGAAPG